LWPRLACYWTLKVAFTVAAPVMVTEQVALLEPEHAPPQPAKVEPALGTAVRVTTVPLGKVSEHLAPQSMSLHRARYLQHLVLRAFLPLSHTTQQMLLHLKDLSH